MGADRALVVLGDLNDEAAAATTQMLLGPPGSQIGTGGFDHPDAGDGMRLCLLAPLIPDGDGFSRIYEGRRELFDHLLVSRRLVGPATCPASACTTRAPRRSGPTRWSAETSRLRPRPRLRPPQHLKGLGPSWMGSAQLFT